MHTVLRTSQEHKWHLSDEGMNFFCARSCDNEKSWTSNFFRKELFRKIFARVRLLVKLDICQTTHIRLLLWKTISAKSGEMQLGGEITELGSTGSNRIKRQSQSDSWSRSKRRRKIPRSVRNFIKCQSRRANDPFEWSEYFMKLRLLFYSWNFDFFQLPFGYGSHAETTPSAKTSIF